MTQSVELLIRLPADLARNAHEFGFLTDEALEHLLRHALDQCISEIVDEEISVYRPK